MEHNLILPPVQIANGEMSRKQITATVNESAKNNSLLPLDHVRFYRELSKGASDAEKIKNANGYTIAQLAIEQAKNEPEYIRAVQEGKKEFLYNGCYYQLRIEESVDLSTRSGEEADTWRANKKKAKEMESQIADLRARLSNVKDAIAGAEKRYIAKHPSCKKTVKQTLVVL